MLSADAKSVGSCCHTNHNRCYYKACACSAQCKQQGCQSSTSYERNTCTFVIDIGSIFLFGIFFFLVLHSIVQYSTCCCCEYRATTLRAGCIVKVLRSEDKVCLHAVILIYTYIYTACPCSDLVAWLMRSAVSCFVPFRMQSSYGAGPSCQLLEHGCTLIRVPLGFASTLCQDCLCLSEVSDIFCVLVGIPRWQTPGNRAATKVWIAQCALRQAASISCPRHADTQLVTSNNPVELHTWGRHYFKASGPSLLIDLGVNRLTN